MQANIHQSATKYDVQKSTKSLKTLIKQTQSNLDHKSFMLGMLVIFTAIIVIAVFLIAK